MASRWAGSTCCRPARARAAEGLARKSAAAGGKSAGARARGVDDRRAHGRSCRREPHAEPAGLLAARPEDEAPRGEPRDEGRGQLRRRPRPGQRDAEAEVAQALGAAPADHRAGHVAPGGAAGLEGEEHARARDADPVRPARDRPRQVDVRQRLDRDQRHVQRLPARAPRRRQPVLDPAGRTGHEHARLHARAASMTRAGRERCGTPQNVPLAASCDQRSLRKAHGRSPACAQPCSSSTKRTSLVRVRAPVPSGLRTCPPGVI